MQKNAIRAAWSIKGGILAGISLNLPSLRGLIAICNTNMTKREIINRFEELLKNEQLEEIRAEVETVEHEFEQAADELEASQRAAFVAEGGDEEEFELKLDDEDHRYKELLNIYTDRVKEHEAALAKSEQENLEIKQKVVAELKELIGSVISGDRIAQAFEKFNELRETWRNTGPVPAKIYKQLQSDYSHQIDMFFYNVEIYRELRIHDFNKNLESKKALVQQVKELLEETSIKKMDDMVKAFQTEWSEIGPVKEEDWKELRNEFWTSVNAVYDKIGAHYSNIREQQQKNLEAKQALVDQVKSIKSEEFRQPKAWMNATEEIKKWQDDWKQIGRAAQQDNNRVWKEFREACNVFFDARKEFFKEQKAEFSKVKEHKLKLIAEAEKLKDDTNWKETSQRFYDLQEEWKNAGSAGHKDEKQLWADFRAVCDHFFNAKKEFFDTLEDRQAANLKEKEAMLKELEAFENSGDNKKDLAALKELATRWRAIGHIPKDKIGEINNAYSKAMDANYAKLKMDKEAKSMARFSNKVESMEQADNSDHMLQKEYRNVMDHIKELKETITLYENNLGFFGPSKGAEALKQDVLKKIDKAKEELAVWEKKKDMLPKSAKVSSRPPQRGGGRFKGGKGGNRNKGRR